MNDLPKFLNWIADRLVHVYGESPNVDFVLACRRYADALPLSLTSETEYLLASPANAAHLQRSSELFSSGVAVPRELIEVGEDFSQAQPGPYRCKHGCERDSLMEKIHALEAGLPSIVGETE